MIPIVVNKAQRDVLKRQIRALVVEVKAGADAPVPLTVLADRLGWTDFEIGVVEMLVREMGEDEANVTPFLVVGNGGVFGVFSPQDRVAATSCLIARIRQYKAALRALEPNRPRTRKHT